MARTNMKYFIALIGSLALLILFAPQALAKQDKNVPNGQALGLSKQELALSEKQNGNPGSIWTTNSTGSQQDKNQYQRGDNLYLHGQKLPTGTLTYTIYTNPPSAKKGTVVATGTVVIPTDGQLSATLIWDIPILASSGVYKVVLITGSHKSDNFKIVKGMKEEKPPAPPVPPPVTPPPTAEGRGGGPILVAQAKAATSVTKLPPTGPGNYLPFVLAALTIGLYLGLKKFLAKKI